MTGVKFGRFTQSESARTDEPDGDYCRLFNGGRLSNIKSSPSWYTLLAAESRASLHTKRGKKQKSRYTNVYPG